MTEKKSQREHGGITDGSHRALMYAGEVRCAVFAYNHHPDQGDSCVNLE